MWHSHTTSLSIKIFASRRFNSATANINHEASIMGGANIVFVRTEPSVQTRQVNNLWEDNYAASARSIKHFRYRVVVPKY